MRLDGYLFCNIMYNNYVLFSVIVVFFFLLFLIYLFSALSIVRTASLLYYGVLREVDIV